MLPLLTNPAPANSSAPTPVLEPPTIVQRLPLLTYQDEPDGDIFIALTFRHPRKVGCEVSWGTVRCRPPRMGQYLQTHPESPSALPFIDFWLPRVPHPVEEQWMRVSKWRIVVTNWSREHQLLTLINGGFVWGLVDMWFNLEMMEVRQRRDYPISLRGGFESH